MEQKKLYRCCVSNSVINEEYITVNIAINVNLVTCVLKWTNQGVKGDDNIVWFKIKERHVCSYLFRDSSISVINIEQLFKSILATFPEVYINLKHKTHLPIAGFVLPTGLFLIFY